jgi:hypothetical protein
VTGLLVNFLDVGHIFPHSPFQEFINGAKMALKCLVAFLNMAICGGCTGDVPHIQAPRPGTSPAVIFGGCCALQRIRTDNRLIRRSGITPIIVAGILGHSLAILMTTYAHLARYARYACNIPGTQDEAARLMDEILTPIPIDLGDLG